MALTTVAVQILVTGQTGLPVQNATVSALLTASDIDTISGGYVIPEAVSAVTNSSGIATINLWPNALGNLGTQYVFTINDPTGFGRTYQITATIPNQNCRLDQVANIPSSTGTNTTTANTATNAIQLNGQPASYYASVTYVNTSLASYLPKDSNGNIIANIVPRTGNHGTLPATLGYSGGVVSGIESLSASAGELGSCVDYPEIVQFTGNATPAATYLPNGLQLITVNPSDPSIIAASYTLTSITGGILSVTSTSPNCVVTLQLPNGAYANQVLQVYNNIPQSYSASYVPGQINFTGTNATYLNVIAINYGQVTTLVWNAANSQWTQGQPTYQLSNLPFTFSGGYTTASFFNTNIVLGSNQISGFGSEISISPSGTNTSSVNPGSGGYANTISLDTVGAQISGTGNILAAGQATNATTGTAHSGIGNNPVVSGALALGHNANVGASQSAFNGIAIGANTTTSGFNAAAIGDGAHNLNSMSMTLGNNAGRSFATLGHNTLAINTSVELTLDGATPSGTTTGAPVAYTDNRYFINNPISGAVAWRFVRVTIIGYVSAQPTYFCKYVRDCIFQKSSAGVLSTLSVTNPAGSDVISSAAAATIGAAPVITIGTYGQLSIVVSGLTSTYTMSFRAYIEDYACS